MSRNKGGDACKDFIIIGRKGSSYYSTILATELCRGLSILTEVRRLCEMASSYIVLL